MKLAQRMVQSFCASISTSNSHRWTTVSGMNEVGVRVHKSTDPGQPNGVVLNAATTFWLPVSPLIAMFTAGRSTGQYTTSEPDASMQLSCRISILF